MSARFEVVHTDAGFHVRVVGENGEPLMTSEVLTSQANALNNIDAVISIVKSASAQGIPVHMLDEQGEDT